MALGNKGLLALQAAGVLLVGVTLSSCGQPTGQSSGQSNEVAPAPGTSSSEVSGSPGSGVGESVPQSSASSAAGSENGDSGSNGSGATDAGQSTKGTSGIDRCHTSQLVGSLAPSDPGAGQRYAELTLTNITEETCTLYGYGGLQLYDGNDQPLPTDLTRDANPGPDMIELAPTGSVSKTLHWTAMPTGGEGDPCQPEPAAAQIIPPDETDPLTVAWSMGPVCGGGSIDGTAYYDVRR